MFTKILLSLSIGLATIGNLYAMESDRAFSRSPEKVVKLTLFNKCEAPLYIVNKDKIVKKISNLRVRIVKGSFKWGIQEASAELYKFMNCYANDIPAISLPEQNEEIAKDLKIQSLPSHLTSWSGYFDASQHDEIAVIYSFDIEGRNKRFSCFKKFLLEKPLSGTMDLHLYFCGIDPKTAEARVTLKVPSQEVSLQEILSQRYDDFFGEG